MASKNKSNRMGEEKIAPLLFKLSAPAIIGMLIQALYNIIDSIYVGRLSTDALSALSLAFPIQTILIAFGVGTGVGASSLISRLLGQGKNEKANNAAEHVFFIAILYGGLGAIAGLFFSSDIIHIFTSNPTLIDLGHQYIRIILIGSLAVFVPATFNYILRGEGNTFLPMLTMLLGAISNIILDPFLIFGIGPFPQLGVAGAAYATIISRLLGGIFITAILFSDKNEIKLNLHRFNFDFQIIREIFTVGLPAIMNRLLFSVTLVVINRILGSFNITAIAVMGIIFRLQSFFMMLVFGLNQGYLPLVGYNYGYNKPDRMKKTIYLGGATAFCFGLLAFLSFQLFTEPLIRLFNSSPELLKIGIPALKRVSPAYLFMVINIIGVATFQAIGQGLPSLIITFLRQFVLLLPSMYLLSNFGGLMKSWFAFPLAEGLTFFLTVGWLFYVARAAVQEMRQEEAGSSF